MVEVIALIFSVAALLVSYASLHLASLRLADVEVDVDRRNTELRSWSYSDGQPNDTYLRLAVFLSNTGAQGALLDELVVADAPEGSSATPWAPLVEDASRPPVDLPIALEAGDVKTAFVLYKLPQPDWANEEFAERVGRMGSLPVVVRWSFVRSRGLPWSWLPARFRRRRERKTRTQPVKIDTSAWRGGVLKYWSQHQDFAQLHALGTGLVVRE